MGVLLGLKIGYFGWKGVGFFSSKIRAKGVFFKLGYERGTLWSGGGAGISFIRTVHIMHHFSYTSPLAI